MIFESNTTAPWHHHNCFPRHGIKRHDRGNRTRSPRPGEVSSRALLAQWAKNAWVDIDGKPVRSNWGEGRPASLLPLDGSGDDARAKKLNSDV